MIVIGHCSIFLSVTDRTAGPKSTSLHPDGPSIGGLSLGQPMDVELTIGFYFIFLTNEEAAVPAFSVT